LKRFLHKNLYQHVHVLQMTEKGQRFLKALFEIYLCKPELLPAYVRKRAESEGVHRSVCDYIAGMTDRYATEEYKRLFESNGV
jgi:dGTPase